MTSSLPVPVEAKQLEVSPGQLLQGRSCSEGLQRDSWRDQQASSLTMTTANTQHHREELTDVSRRVDLTDSLCRIGVFR